MAALRELLAVLDISVDDKDLKKANSLLDNTVDKLKSFGKIVAGGAAALAGLGAAAVYAVKSTAEAVDNLQDSADQLGTSIEDLQKFNYAAERAGVSSEDFSVALKKVADSIIESGDAASASAKGYKALGIETKKANGQAKSSTEIFQELHEVYNNGDEKKKAEVNKLLGGSFAKNLAIFRKTSDEFKALQDQGESLGVATQKQSDIAGKLNDTWDDAFRIVKGFAFILLEILGPGLTKIGEYTQRIIKIFGSFFTSLSGDKSVEDWSVKVEEWVDKAYMAFLDFAIGVTDVLLGLKSAYDTVVKFFKEHTILLELLTSLITGGLIVAIGLLIKALAIATIGWLKMVAAEALALAPILAIAAAIGLVVFAIYQVYKNWDLIKAGAIAAFNAIKEAIINTFNTIKENIASFINWYFGVWKSVFDFIVSMGESVNNYIFDFWDGIINKIKSGISGILDFAKNIFNKVSSLPGVKQILSVVAGNGNNDGKPKAAATDTKGVVPVQNQNINQTQTTTVGKIEVNGAGNPTDVANKVIQVAQTGGNAATMNALTNKRLG